MQLALVPAQNDGEAPQLVPMRNYDFMLRTCALVILWICYGHYNLSSIVLHICFEILYMWHTQPQIPGSATAHVLPLLHHLPHQTSTNVSLVSVSITTMLLPQTKTLLVSIHLGSRYEHVNVSRPQFGAMVFWRLMNTTNLCFATVISFE